MSRKPYPTDVTDDEWNFAAPYLTLMREDAPQRDYPLREVFNALCYVSRSGEAWRMMPNDLPPWPVVFQQMQWWYKTGVFEAMVHVPEAKRGFVLLPRRWVVERSFAWAARFRRIAWDDERLSRTLAGFHLLAFACIMLSKATRLIADSS